VILDKLQLVCLRVEREYVHLGLGITVGLLTSRDRIRFVAVLAGGLGIIELRMICSHIG
jgi:hypothetical protein